jgi:hypothetical protein
VDGGSDIYMYIALILAAVVPVVLTSGWFEAPDVGYGVTYLLFAWFWAMFSAIAGISSHFGLAQPIGWFSFVVAPIFSGMWMLFALMSLNVL